MTRSDLRFVYASFRERGGIVGRSDDAAWIVCVSTRACGAGGTGVVGGSVWVLEAVRRGKGDGSTRGGHAGDVLRDGDFVDGCGGVAFARRTKELIGARGSIGEKDSIVERGRRGEEVRFDARDAAGEGGPVDEREEGITTTAAET